MIAAVMTSTSESGETMRRNAAEQPSLPVQRAFVVQLRPEANVERGHFIGRIEHVMSGQAVNFDSLEGLLVFMARMLKETKKQHRVS